MHSVSPVHIRFENDVKNPVTATNFQDAMLKTKKKVQIVEKAKGPKVKKPSAIVRTRSSRSSITTAQKNKPKPFKKNVNNNLKNVLKSNSGFTCSTCIESRSRSCSASPPQSPEPSKNLSQTSIHSSTSCDQRCLTNNNLSLSPIRNLTPSPLNQTYTMSNRSRSFDSFLRDSPCLMNKQRRSNSCDQCLERSFSQQSVNPGVLANGDRLVRRLVETELSANEIARQLSLLKDFLKLELVNPQKYLNPLNVKHLENERNRLLNHLGSFECLNRDLKEAIVEVTNSAITGDLRRMQDNDALIKHIDALEIENLNYKKTLLDMEKNVHFTGNANDALSHENNALSNLKQSLEDNRAHLRRNLLAKESEISRLNVQLKNLIRKFERASLEIDLLRENRKRTNLPPIQMPAKTNPINTLKKPPNNSNNNNNNNNKNLKVIKQYFTLEEILSDPAKVKLYVDKLNLQLKEKDEMIKSLNEAKQNSDESNSEQKSERNERIQNEKLRKEVEKLKTQAHVKDEKLKTAESRLKNIEKKLKESQTKQQKNSSTTAATTSGSSSSNSEERDNHNNKNQVIERIQNFNQKEVDRVVSVLQNRINELEHLPELLKNEELKVEEMNKKIRFYEVENSEVKKAGNDVKNELELTRGKYENLKQKLKEMKINLESKEAANKSREEFAKQTSEILKQEFINESKDTIEKKLVILDEQNKELQRQLAHKEEIIRDLTGKFAEKTNEAASFSRQFDRAINESNLKHQQLKDEFESKERKLNAKYAELESQLRSAKYFSSNDRREKEDKTQSYEVQVKDLKARLEQAQNTNRQMQEYVNFLKNSYMTYFDDSTLHGFENPSTHLIGSYTSII